MKYRPEIDGLRTLAVLPVILFHAGVPGLDGGFLGVDIFFVISGFLITTILIKDLEAGRYSILTFYERRARRILPALFVVVLACVPFAWAWMFADQLRDFGQSVVATSGFSSNILFWVETGYFSWINDTKPLLHTWSLAIEEQYYILFPPLLALAWQLGRKAVFGLVLGIAVVSLVVAQIGAYHFPEANFYLLPSRAWELMIGGLAGFWMTWRTPKANGGLALAGLAMIAAAFVFMSERNPHPSLVTLLPVVGTALIALFARQGTLVARLLSLKPMVAIGLISYSAYLWHQPLFAFARLRTLHEPSLGLMLGLAALTLVLAALTWRFIEQPFRRHAGQPPRLLPRRGPLLQGAAASLVAMIAVGATLHVIDGAPWRVPEAASTAIASRYERNPLRDACHQNVRYLSQLQLPPPAPCVTEIAAGKTPVGRAVILGDSHADAIASPVRKMLEAKGWQVTELTVTSCEPVPGIRKGTRNCNALNGAIHKYVRTLSPDLIVAGMRAQMMFDEDEFESDPASNHRFLPDALGLAADEPREVYAEAAIRQSIATMLEMASTVVIVHPIPEADADIPELVAKKAFFMGEEAPEISSAIAEFHERAGAANAILNDIDSPRLFHVHPEKALCVEDRCLSARPGEIYYYDDDHLSLTGAKLVTAQIEKELPAIRDTISMKAASNL